MLTISFDLDGTRFTALNGGPDHKFNDAISFVVRCDSQDEADYYWTDGGSEIACGWLRDKWALLADASVRIFELLRHPKALQAMIDHEEAGHCGT